VSLGVLGATFLGVATVYVAIVLGGGVLVGHTQSPHVGLSILATAIVALGFEPMRARLQAVAAQRVQAGRLSPYDVLSRFSESLTAQPAGTEPSDLPLTMARLLAEGTNARWAQVWVMVADRPELAAAWPADADAPAVAAGDPGVRSLDVTLADVKLGMLRLQEHPDAPLTPVEAQLFEGLAAQAGLVLRRAQLRAELSHRARDLGVLEEELLASRQRVVDTHDLERRRLERDIHDGAQQHLVALVVNLRLAQTLAERSSDRAGAVLAEQGSAVDSAITTLVELSRGIYPQVLAEQGVAAAIRGLVSTSAIPVSVLDRGIGRRSAELEAALYFCCSEAIQNAVKHASASRIEVELDAAADRVTLLVRDDGIGFVTPAALTAGGLGNMRDRVDSVGGDIAVRANELGGTDVLASMPS
jgi:signal transduction histidine kinase